MIDNPLWDYSLKLYANVGVAAHCIDLQDRFGANVNVLLFACWLGNQGLVFDDDALRDMQTTVAQWNRDVTLPIRAQRRGLDSARTGAAQEKRRLLARELEAEREEQTRLFNWYNEHFAALSVLSPATAIAHNLNLYIAIFGGDSATTQPLLEAALAGC